MSYARTTPALFSLRRCRSPLARLAACLCWAAMVREMMGRGERGRG